MIKIDNMNIRMPGLSEAEGRRVAGEVARLLAERLPVYAFDRNLDTLDLRLELPTGPVDPDRIAGQIADAILRGVVFK